MTNSKGLDGHSKWSDSPNQLERKSVTSNKLCYIVSMYYQKTWSWSVDWYKPVCPAPPQDQWIGASDLSKGPGNFGLWRWCTDTQVRMVLTTVLLMSSWSRTTRRSAEEAWMNFRQFSLQHSGIVLAFFHKTSPQLVFLCTILYIICEIRVVWELWCWWQEMQHLKRFVIIYVKNLDLYTFKSQHPEWYTLNNLDSIFRAVQISRWTMLCMFL